MITILCVTWALVLFIGYCVVRSGDSSYIKKG